MRKRMKGSDEQYRLNRKGTAEYLTFPALEEYPELVHLFTTRKGGVSEGCCATWNFGAWNLDSEENILRNYEILADVLGITTMDMVRSAQTHTPNIRTVTAADGGKGIARERDYRDIDGLVTDVRGMAIVTSHADCNAVFFFDPRRQVIGLAHSGWRGTLAGISTAMIGKMEAQYGCNPADIVAGLGPAICQDCFEVDEDVAQLFFEAKSVYEAFAVKRGIKQHIDLKGIIRYELLECGLAEEHLLDMGLCTKCNPSLLFSHRGQKGKRGIMSAVMMLR